MEVSNKVAVAKLKENNDDAKAFVNSGAQMTFVSIDFAKRCHIDNLIDTTDYKIERFPTMKMPFPLVWYKGSVYITFNRVFIRYIFESPRAKVILNALQNNSIPDEQSFATLNFNAKHLFANKFYEDFQPATLRYLWRWNYEKVENETLNRKTNINVSYYKSQIFVLNQFLVSGFNCAEKVHVNK